MTRTGTTINSSRKGNRESNLNKTCKVLNVFLVAAIALSGAYYVALVNDLTIKGIKVQELKREKTSLKQENRNLNVRVTSLKSYQSIAKRTEGMNMTSVENVDYIKIPSGVLAKK